MILVVKKISLDDYEGKAVLLNFSAIWCRHSLKMLNNLKAIQDEINNPTFILNKGYDERCKIITILTDNRSIYSDYKTILNHYNFPIIKGGVKDAKNYYIYGFPLTFLINPNGLVEAIPKQFDSNLLISLRNSWDNAHYNMVRIHPFDDGNGRGSRILNSHLQ